MTKKFLLLIVTVFLCVFSLGLVACDNANVIEKYYLDTNGNLIAEFEDGSTKDLGTLGDTIANGVEIIFISDDGFYVVNGIKTAIVAVEKHDCLSQGHKFDLASACVDKQCVIDGCNYIEKATVEHEYTMEYVCSMCDKTKPCTLEIIASDYKEEMFALIDGYGFSVYGNMEIVILDAQQTIDINKNIQNIRLAYTDKNEFDENKIVKGLFVKVNSKETLGADLYFNFALEFNEKQKSDIVVFASETDEIWLLEVVEGNKTIVFEYGVLYRYFFVN